MDHFIVRKRQDEVLAEGVHAAEGQLAVVVFAEDRVPRYEVQHVVHPAHVPLRSETQPAQVGGARHHGKRGGFLGYGDDAGMVLVDDVVQALPEPSPTEVIMPESQESPPALLPQDISSD